MQIFYFSIFISKFLCPESLLALTLCKKKKKTWYIVLSTRTLYIHPRSVDCSNAWITKTNNDRDSIQDPK